MSKPSNPQGTRDFSPQVMRKRNFLTNTIKGVFEKYGFEHLETPALENLTTLTGKYGDEGDKLLYKIRSNKEISQEIESAKAIGIKTLLPDRWIPGKSKLGLRYDLTVPFARFVVQHRNDVVFPFRRYQIQPVWRADRPQRGRFREFVQCDADSIGSKSLMQEADLIQIYNDTLSTIGLNNAVLRINHRKLLEAIVDEVGLSFNVGRFTTSLDKLDKIGKEGVAQEFQNLGATEDSIAQIFDLIDQGSLTLDFVNSVETKFTSEKAKLACAELRDVLSFLNITEFKIKVELDMSLARGLDYYTGCIFEVVVPGSGIGSISGGGRYDDLTSIFGLKDVSGVGISFGIDRIYEILEAQDLWPLYLDKSKGVLFCHFSNENQQYCNDVARILRANGINCLVYPDRKKIGKQFEYADKANYPIAVVVGDQEMKSNLLSVKDMKSGEQKKLTLSQLTEQLS